MPTFELDYEAIESIIRSSLKDDYKSCREDVRKLKNKVNLAPHLMEDLENYSKYCVAFETLFEYYFTERDRLDIIDNEDQLDDEFRYGKDSPYEEDDYQEPPYGAMGDPDMPVADPALNTQFWAIQDKVDKLEKKIDALLNMQLRNDYNRHVDV